MIAEFNTNIDIPSVTSTEITYDLNAVITKTGFRGTNYTYRLVGQQPAGVSIDTYILTINNTVKPKTEIMVYVTSDVEGESALATTSTYGFNCGLDDINNNKDIKSTKEALMSKWNKIIPQQG